MSFLKSRSLAASLLFAAASQHAVADTGDSGAPAISPFAEYSAAKVEVCLERVSGGSETNQLLGTRDLKDKEGVVLAFIARPAALVRGLDCSITTTGAGADPGQRLVTIEMKDDAYGWRRSARIEVTLRAGAAADTRVTLKTNGKQTIADLNGGVLGQYHGDDFVGGTVRDCRTFDDNQPDLCVMRSVRIRDLAAPQQSDLAYLSALANQVEAVAAKRYGLTAARPARFSVPGQ